MTTVFALVVLAAVLGVLSSYLPVRLAAREIPVRASRAPEHSRRRL